MAAINFTGNGQQKTLAELFCSPSLAAELHGQLTFLSVLNSLLSVTAFFGNALILIALHKESSLHPPSKLLLRNLVTTDLCVGLISVLRIGCLWRMDVEIFVLALHWQVL